MTYRELIERLQTLAANVETAPLLDDTVVCYNPYTQTFLPCDLLVADESGNEIVGSENRLYVLLYDWNEKYLFDKSPLKF